MFFDVQFNFDAIKKEVHPTTFCVKCNRMLNIGCYLGLCIVAMETKFMLGVQELRN